MERLFDKAKWIWKAGRPEYDEYVDFFAVFQGEKGKDYRLCIAADSQYTVWLNGKMAAFGQYADYPTYKVADEVDLGDRIVDGENRLVITAWYHGVNTQTYCRGKAGVIFSVWEDGAEIVFSSAQTPSRLSRGYISHEERLITDQLGLTYHYDMKDYDGYRKRPFSVKGFAASRVVRGVSYDIHRRPNKKLILKERLPMRICQQGAFTYRDDSEPISRAMQYAALSFCDESDAFSPMREKFPHKQFYCAKPFFDEINEEIRIRAQGGDGVYFIVDLGEETAGFLDIDLELPRSCRIDVGFGEHLEDGRCRTAIRNFTCRIEGKRGRNKFLGTFRRFGCRYLQFFVHAKSVGVHYAGIRPTVYPLTAKKFESGNLLRDTIYQVCQKTLETCMHEHYEDCPWREQALYTLDSRNQMLCGYYAFGEYQMPRATLELMTHGLRDDGLLSLCFPAGRDFPIPSYTLAYILQTCEYTEYSRDVTFAQEHYAFLERLMKTFVDKIDERGLAENFYAEKGKSAYWNFFEWSNTLAGKFGETEKYFEAPLSAFLSLASQAMTKISALLCKEAEAEKYGALTKRLNAAIARYFFNPETGLFETCIERYHGQYSVFTNSICLLCGAAKGLPQDKILRLLVTNGEDDLGGLCVIPNTLSMNSFRFDALLSVDREKYAPMILDEIDREYLSMLRQGATTFWETSLGAADFNDAGSLCHGWSALPIYYYEILSDLM